MASRVSSRFGQPSPLRRPQSIYSPPIAIQNDGLTPPGTPSFDNTRSKTYNRTTLNGPPPSKPPPPPQPTSISIFSLAVWPIMLAVFPPIFTFFFGMEDFWSDLFLLHLVVFYLYNLIQTPWDLYQASRQRRKSNPMDAAFTGQEPGDAVLEAQRYRAQVGLWWRERLCFLLVLISPIIGGYLFFLARVQLQVLNAFVSNFNIILFVLAAEVRPVKHLASLLLAGTNELQDITHHPTPALEAMALRMAVLEAELGQLKKAYSYKRDPGPSEDTESQLGQLSRLVMKQHHKDKLEMKRYDALIADLQKQLYTLRKGESHSPLIRNEDSLSNEVGEIIDVAHNELTKLISGKALSLPRVTLKLLILPFTMTASILALLVGRFIPIRLT